MIPLMQIIKIMCIRAHKPYMLTKHARIKQYTIMAYICLNLYKKSKIIYIMLKRIGPKLSIKTYLLLNKNLIHDHNGQANLKNSNGQKMNIKSGREQKPTAQAYISQTNFTKALQGALGTSLNKNEKKKRNETPLTPLFCFSYLFPTQICPLSSF